MSTPTKAVAFNARQTYFGMKPSNQSEVIATRAKRATIKIDKKNKKDWEHKRTTKLPQQLRDKLKEMQSSGERGNIDDYDPDADDDDDMPPGFGFDDDFGGDSWKTESATAPRKDGSRQVVVEGGTEIEIIDYNVDKDGNPREPDQGLVAAVGRVTFSEGKVMLKTDLDDPPPPRESVVAGDVKEFNEKLLEERNEELRKARKSKAAVKAAVVEGVDLSSHNAISSKLSTASSRDRSRIRTQVMKKSIYNKDRPPKDLKVDYETVEVRPGKRKTTARLSSKVTKPPDE